MNDAELIRSLGGPAALAERLKFKKDGGVQRVANWVKRGIPWRIKAENPSIFKRKTPVAPSPVTKPARPNPTATRG
jgi:hypothetical protein